MEIYWEQQRGGLCRLHSINAYFGKQEFNEKEFNEHADEFDSIQYDKFGENISCKTFDIVNSDQCNLVTHILSSRGIYVRYVPPNEHKECVSIAINAGCFFVFNLDHIWFVKKYDKEWYRVDSMSGVSIIDPMTIINEKNIGLMIPIQNKLTEFCRIGALLCDIIGPDVSQFIIDKHVSASILGDAETCLGPMVEVLRVQQNCGKGVLSIKQFIDKYDSFIKKMITNGNRNNLPFLLRDACWVIRALIKIFKRSAVIS
jgi:hypothetical protein